MFFVRFYFKIPVLLKTAFCFLWSLPETGLVILYSVSSFVPYLRGVCSLDGALAMVELHTGHRTHGPAWSRTVPLPLNSIRLGKASLPGARLYLPGASNLPGTKPPPPLNCTLHSGACVSTKPPSQGPLARGLLSGLRTRPPALSTESNPLPTVCCEPLSPSGHCLC